MIEIILCTDGLGGCGLRLLGSLDLHRGDGALVVSEPSLDIFYLFFNSVLAVDLLDDLTGSTIGVFVFDCDYRFRLAHISLSRRCGGAIARLIT